MERRSRERLEITVRYLGRDIDGIGAVKGAAVHERLVTSVCLGGGRVLLREVDRGLLGARGDGYHCANEEM